MGIYTIVRNTLAGGVNIRACRNPLSTNHAT